MAVFNPCEINHKFKMPIVKTEFFNGMLTIILLNNQCCHI